MVANEDKSGRFWSIFDFEGWWYVNMVPQKPDMYTRTLAEH